MIFINRQIILFLFLMIGLNCFSQINISDSVIVEQVSKSKFRYSLGVGVTNIEQKITGPSTNLTSNLNVINFGLNSNYKISDKYFIEASVATLIGASFNYYYDNKNSLTNIYIPKSNLDYVRPISSSFSLLSTSVNFNTVILKNKPKYLFFIPNYVFIGPKYDAYFGGGPFKSKNYIGYQYGFKYKFSLKYSNVYPVVMFSKSPKSNEGNALVSNITNNFIGFSLFIESKEGKRKFKKYVAPPQLKFTEIPLFRWLKN